MKLSEYIVDVGKPVAYYPGLKRVTQSTTATILLCQFIYWKNKETTDDGSIYKTSAEIQKETGLTYEEQKTARAKLKSIGLLEERYARLDHTIYFKIDINRLDALWASSQGQDGHRANGTVANEPLTDSFNSNTESTTKNTTDNNNDFPKAGKSSTYYEPCDDDGLPIKEKKRSKYIRKEQEQLGKNIADMLGLPVPRPTSASEFKQYRVTWWSPIQRMLEITGDDIDRATKLAKSATDKLRSINYATASPKSLLTTFEAFASEQSAGIDREHEGMEKVWNGQDWQYIPKA